MMSRSASPVLDFENFFPSDEHGEVDFNHLLELKWKIKYDDRFINEMIFGKGEVISKSCSTAFEEQKTLWWLRLFPTKNDDEYSSISLNNDSSKKVSDLKLHFSLFDKDNTKLQECTLDNGEWEASKFVKNTFLRDPENSQIMIVCQVLPAGSSQGNKMLRSLNILDDFEKLLLSKKFSDLTIVSADDKELHVHKAMLVSRSPVFEVMFEHDMIEKNQNIVEIKDIKYEVLLELFRFMYSGKVDGIEKIHCELLIAAEKYSIQGLKLLCEEAMLDQLNETNAIEYLIEADKNNASFLKMKILKFFSKNLHQLAKQPEFKSISHPDLLHEIISASVEEK